MPCLGYREARSSVDVMFSFCAMPTGISCDVPASKKVNRVVTHLARL